MTSRILLALTLSAGLALPTLAQALPAAGVARVALTPDASGIHKIDYRGYRGGYYRGGYRGYRGRNIGIGIGAAIVGGVIVSQALRAERRNYGGGARQHCADTYRSFDWDSGTYMGYDGERHVCPYLR